MGPVVFSHAFPAKVTVPTTVLLVAVVSLSFSVTAPPAAAAGTRWFVAPEATGQASGTDPTAAAALSDLPRIVATADPGDEVILLADRGDYRISEAVNIAAGGTAAAPITIRGGVADGSPATATLVGTRADPWFPGAADGRETFRLNGGADHLHFSHLSFRDVGSAIRVTADLTGLVVDTTSAVNVRRFLDTLATGTEPSASLTAAVISDVTVSGFSKGAIRLRYDSHDVVIQDVVGDSERQDGDNFAMGIHLTGTTHDVLMRRVGMHNSTDTTNAYWNGDGFAAERGTYDLIFEATSATGSTDAGYDLKSTATTLVAAHAADNKRNYRIWADATIVGCEGTDPHHRGGSGSPAQLWVDEQATVEVYGCDFAQDDPESRFDIPAFAEVTISDAVPADLQLVLDDVIRQTAAGAPADEPVTSELPQGHERPRSDPEIPEVTHYMR